jgi:hypothetical protein
VHPALGKQGRKYIMTECTQESGHRQSIYSLVCDQHNYYSGLLMSKRIDEVRRTSFLCTSQRVAGSCRFSLDCSAPVSHTLSKSLVPKSLPASQLRPS